MGVVHFHGLFLYFYIFLINFSTTSSDSDSEALLKLKESFKDAVALDSWKPGTEPCSDNENWVGVICENGVVSGLRLEHLGLSGKIDVDALVSVSGLRSISFMSNSFSGRIPEFHKMEALKGLYLSGNKFSGEISADYFTKMEGLRKVWISGNMFSGPIPYSLFHLSHLVELHLENNQFSGTIPPLDQPSLISLDLSNNKLSGEIPSGLLKFSSSSFKGNPGLCGGNVGKACEPSMNSSTRPENSENSDNATKIGLWILIASALVLFLTVVGILVKRKRQENLDVIVKGDLDNPCTFNVPSSVEKKDFGSSRKGFGSSTRRVGSSRKRAGDLVIINDEKGMFGLADLMKAAAEVLGNGALGSSYKATMANGLTVVVKRLKETNKMGKDQFDAEMRKLGRLNHNNILTPLAYHYRKDERLLVYEYQPKGSLLFLLHGDCGISHADLNWPTRLKIVKGIAKGLGYLHTELSSLDLPHGDLKSSNVLLTTNYEPILTEYGFCSLITSTQAARELTAYKSPEAALHHPISPKCDVFCLGIIILEILTGKFPSQYLNNGQGGIDLVQWVQSAICEGKEADLFDPDIASSAKNSVGHEMEQLLLIGAACIETDPEQRMDIREAIRRIEEIPNEGSVQETRTLDIMPSLNNGFADHQSMTAYPYQDLEHNSNDHSDRSRDNAGYQWGHDSFVFQIT